jgi:uncharacterized protein (DUF362 family)
MREINRREFLKTLAAAGAAVGARPLWPEPARGGRLFDGPSVGIPEIDPSGLVVVEKGEPSALVRRALAEMGGIGRFVKKGDVVVVKPNVAWARTPQQACNTNPDIVETIVRLCVEAGAGRVEVWDHTCDEFSLCFSLSGIKAAAEKAGARVYSGHIRGAYREVEIPGAKSLKKAELLRSVLDADVLINLPVAKVHSATGHTFSMKNFVGINWNMRAVHQTPMGIHQGIADISTLVKPDLIITDAIKTLVTNGPKGPGKLLDIGQVIVGVDPVAMDSYCATLFNKKPAEIPFIKLAGHMGLGEMDLNKIRVKSVTA